MKLPRWIPITALVLFALLLGGCINIQQEYWLYEDGTAKVRMDIGMSQALLSMGATSGSDSTTNPFEDLKSEFNDTNPNIKNVQVREYADDDLQHFEVIFEVPDFEKFLKEQASQGSEFNITLTRTPDDSILFKQITQLDTGGEASGLDVDSMGPVFKDMFWSVTVHVPQVVSTNGERLDNSTVQWKIPMADIFSGKAPGELTMVYKPKGAIGGGGIFGAGGGAASWLIYLVVGIVVLLVAGGAAYYFLVLRKRPTAESVYGSYPPPPPGQPQQGDPSQWGAPPPQQNVPPQWSAPPPQAGNLPPQWNAQPQPGTPEAYPPQQQPPVQDSQTPPPPPDYPAYPQYTPPPQYPPGSAQGNDNYPQYPPQQPPAASPPVEPPPDQPKQS